MMTMTAIADDVNDDVDDNHDSEIDNAQYQSDHDQDGRKRLNDDDGTIMMAMADDRTATLLTITTVKLKT